MTMTYEELREMALDIAEVQYPAMSPYWEAHTWYLLENFPERTRELYKQGKLKAELERVVKAALVLKMELTLAGDLAPDQIQEHVYAALVSPPNGPADRPDPPEPLPPDEQLEIIRWSEGQSNIEID